MIFNAEFKFEAFPYCDKFDFKQKLMKMKIFVNTDHELDLFHTDCGGI